MGFYKKYDEYHPLYGIKSYDLRVETEILRIVEVLEIQGKIKTVFECKSGTGAPRTCIYWEETNAKAGDKVQLTGFMKDNRFIVKRILITEKKERTE